MRHTAFGLLFLAYVAVDGKADIPVRADGHYWYFVRVIDGDTFQIRVPCLPPALSLISVRVRGVDTPERGTKARCMLEYHLAEEASGFAARFLMPGPITLENLRWDKYGGRIDADVWVAGQSLGQALLKVRLAHIYDGGKKADWCS